MVKIECETLLCGRRKIISRKMVTSCSLGLDPFPGFSFDHDHDHPHLPTSHAPNLGITLGASPAFTVTASALAFLSFLTIGAGPCSPTRQVPGVLCKTDTDLAQSLEGKLTITQATTPKGEEHSTQKDRGGTEGPGLRTQGEPQ